MFHLGILFSNGMCVLRDRSFIVQLLLKYSVLRSDREMIGTEVFIGGGRRDGAMQLSALLVGLEGNSCVFFKKRTPLLGVKPKENV